jgi:hypothetical protein
MTRRLIAPALLAMLLFLSACGSSDDASSDPPGPTEPPLETALAEVIAFPADSTTSRRFDVVVAVPDSGLGVSHVELWARPQAGDWFLEATVNQPGAVRVNLPLEGPFGPWEFAAVAVPLNGDPVDQLAGAEAAVEVPELITITDRHGEVWEITHAVLRHGMSLPGWENGIGRHTLRPIIEPALSCAGDIDYPDPENLAVVLGMVVEGEARAYKLGDLNDTEVVDDIIGETHVAVTY